jgi:hypothetical protein
LANIDKATAIYDSVKKEQKQANAKTHKTKEKESAYER